MMEQLNQKGWQANLSICCKRASRADVLAMGVSPAEIDERLRNLQLDVDLGLLAMDRKPTELEQRLRDPKEINLFVIAFDGQHRLV